jgi:branched-chain amino acid transport system substrate-binding protein
MNMLATAFRQSKSTAPTQVAYALEGMKYKRPKGEVEVRRTDHPLLGPLYLGSWAKQDGKRVKYDAENTGYGFRVDAAVDTYVSAQPTSRQMKRPPKP